MSVFPVSMSVFRASISIHAIVLSELLYNPNNKTGQAMTAMWEGMCSSPHPLDPDRCLVPLLTFSRAYFIDSFRSDDDDLSDEAEDDSFTDLRWA